MTFIQICFFEKMIVTSYHSRYSIFYRYIEQIVDEIAAQNIVLLKIMAFGCFSEVEWQLIKNYQDKNFNMDAIMNIFTCSFFNRQSNEKSCNRVQCGQ
ncbi:hypothetical protein HZU67_08455 [Apis mellifera carnica]|nr:hypothetical protein HZU67_08455 [Apis mellifera carnica]